MSFLRPGGRSIPRRFHTWLEKPSSMVEDYRREAENASGLECLMEPVYGRLALRGIRAKPKFEQCHGRDESNDGSMSTQDPFGMHPSTEKVDQDSGVEQNLSAYR